MLLGGGGGHHFQVLGRRYFARRTDIFEILLCVILHATDSKFTDVHEFEISGKRTGYVAGVSKELENMITEMQFTIYENVEVFHTLHHWCFH